MKRKVNSETQAFERALRRNPETDYYLRLYVTGTTPKSARAIQNIRAICEEKLAGRYDLEVIDIYQNPGMAQPDQIVVTPTLLKRLPQPVRRLIGDLSDEESVLVGLDLIARERPRHPGHAGETRKKNAR